MLEGGCFCGFVRYRIGGRPRDETLCHCSTCRRISGAPAVAWFTVPAAELYFTAAGPARFRSSERASRSFCPRCGTPLTFALDEAPEEIDVTTCSLDAPEALPPKDHTHTGTRLSWMERSDLLPVFRGTRE